MVVVVVDVITFSIEAIYDFYSLYSSCPASSTFTLPILSTLLDL